MGLKKSILGVIRKIFKKQKDVEPAKTYVERDTFCDKCAHLEHCISECNVVCSHTLADTRSHYIRGLGGNCVMEDDLK